MVVKEMNDQEVLVVALMENLQREDLSAMEEARGFQQLKDEFGLSQEDMAYRLGKSRSAIANTLRLLALPEKACEDLTSGRISAGHARALLVVTDADAQELFRQYLVSKHCTVRDAERIAGVWKDSGLLPEEVARGVTKSPAGKKARAARAGTLQALQEKLVTALALPVSITGKETKGRICVKYASKEELKHVLEKLGIVEEQPIC
ncbi:hypothetical protein FACS1894206_02220 [Deltaproteobacteria bacterium]|nr:hypothetical protein FACS1894206_02220 [Deltaproteobacteria bacterium]